MTEIRYWNGIKAATDVDQQQSINTRKAVDDYGDSFRTQLMGQLSSLGVDGVLSGSSDNIMNGIFKDGPKLMNLDVPGIEKVWAAQMNSPLNYFDGFDNGSGDSDGNGLSGMIDLMLKEQMARARKSIETDTKPYRFDEFVKDIGAPDTAIASTEQAGDNSVVESIDAFVERMRQQIQHASQQFNVPESELWKRAYPSSDEKTG